MSKLDLDQYECIAKCWKDERAGGPTTQRAQMIADSLSTMLLEVIHELRGHHDEIGWLVEWVGRGGIRPSRPTWWSGMPYNQWTHNSLEAVRFARREDAEAMIERRWHDWDGTPEGYIATEHAWILAMEPRVENPDHDSLFTRFEQLADHIDALMDRADELGIPWMKVTAYDALKLLEHIRAQVLK